VTLYVVVVTVIMLWRQISITPEYFLAVLAIAALMLGRLGSFLRDWVPFVVLFLAYEVMRGFADAPGWTPHVGELIAWERALFLGTIPTVWLQQHFYSPGSVAWYDIAAMTFYFLHFVYPLTIGFFLWVGDRYAYRRFVTTLMLTALVGFFIYFAFPTAPPWMAAKLGAIPPVHKIITETLGKIGADHYSVSWFYTHLNPNKVAAFPSLHAAFPYLAALYAAQAWGWRRSWPTLLYLLALVLSIVYLGEHYFVDALAGVVLATAVYLVLERWGGAMGGLRLPWLKAPQA
jgi:membrane-associated phospholipid phosphatase